MVKSSINVYQYGNTIRLECIFRDFDDKKIDPNLVKLIIYNSKYEIVFQTNTVVKKDIGEYFFDYTTENKEQKLFYEWYGEIDGKPSLSRGQFMTKFI